jgi:DNA repair ATPase RecN
VPKQDESQTAIVHSLEKDDSIEFDGIFLMSSELNTAYENALGVLNKTCEMANLKSSIAKIEMLSQKFPSVYPEDISNFVQTLRALMDRISSTDADQQELQHMETSLNDSYNSIAQKLNNHINLD